MFNMLSIRVRTRHKHQLGVRMGIYNIPPNQSPQNKNPKIGKTNEAVLISIQGNNINVKYERVKKVARGMAKVAFLLGETNNEDEYAEEIAEDVFEALKLYSKKKFKKKK